MATIHFILQGKGGVGKSLVASMLVQFLRAKLEEEKVFCVDTDPVNHTLAGYKEFNARVLEIMKGDDIDARQFDYLMEQIFELPEDAHMVVDNGASSFVPLGSYLRENNALELLKEHGHTVFLHTVITGSQAMGDTLAGLDMLARSFENIPIIVWLNRYFGELAIEVDGQSYSFEETIIYKNHSDKFHALIEIPHGKQATFGKDLESVFSQRISFEAAVNSPRPMMERQRIKSFWRDCVEIMEQASFIN